MKLLFLHLLTTIIFFTLYTTANATSASDLAGLLNSIQSMRAKFIQTIYDNRGKAIQRSFGRMAMQRPGKFRWDVTKPIPQLVIANGSRLWIYDPDLQQVTIRSLKKAAGETPALLLSNVSSTVEQDFTVSEMESKTPGLRWFSLIPKQPDNMFASVQMEFQKNHIQEMRLKDNLGHTTRIQYQNPEFNISIAASQFSFSPPAGVDVINETRQK